MLSFLKSVRRRLFRQFDLAAYSLNGRQPWRAGYTTYRNEYIIHSVNSSDLIERFRIGTSLGENFGFGIDERIVEYPWLISRLSDKPIDLLDAGSTLNFDFILAHPTFKQKRIVIYNLSPETTFSSSQVSYIYGDLRETILKSEYFDVITCISVLEHIGMDNTGIYSDDASYKESAPSDYQQALSEFRRLLKSGGKLFLTMPYGRYENHGWFQQFDEVMVSNVINYFQPTAYEITYYKYDESGWKPSTSADCSDCRYSVFNSDKAVSDDHAAAARAVVCLELTKGEKAL